MKNFPAGWTVRRGNDYIVEDYSALAELLEKRPISASDLLDMKLRLLSHTNGLPDFLALKETKLASLLLNIEAPEADQLDATSLREIGASLSNQVTEEERNLDNVLGMIEKEKMLRFLTSIFWISLVVAAFISAVLLSFHLAKVRLGLE
jgi:hypothetical protein